MDADILESLVDDENIMPASGVDITADQGNGEDFMVTDSDFVPDSVSGGDIQGNTSDNVDADEGMVEVIENQVDSPAPGDAVNGWVTVYDDEIGGIPVVIIDEPSVYSAVGTQNGYQMTTYYVDYFAGVLENMHDTDYLAFCTRENVNGSSYVEHNRLVYDITVIGDQAQSGTYPCVDIYRSNSSSTYTVSHTTYNLQVVPSFSYGSFGYFSDLRKDVGHSEIYAVLLFLGFFAVYSVCHDIFDYVMEHIYRK